MASNSTQLITDMASAAGTTFSATAVAAAQAAAGPMMDLTGTLKSCTLKLQEIAQILNYVLGGSAKAPASLTAPAGGLITTGADSTTYNLLVGIFQILK